MVTKLDLLWLCIFNNWPKVNDHKMGERLSVVVASIVVGEMIYCSEHTVKLGLNRPAG